MLDALRRAAGAPVSYAELRAAGIDLPASVVSELELAGVAIEHCVGEGTGLVGVRLDPANEATAQTTPDPEEQSRPPVSRRSPSTRSARSDPQSTRAYAGKRVLALAALVAGIAVVAAIAAISAPGGGRRTAVPIAKRSRPHLVAAASGPPAHRTPAPTGDAPTVPVSPALATELEAQGHSLLEAGRYGDAVPVLKRAVLATGETLGACLEPASSTCLTYAYALYDLGRAERLNGEPQAAVPILERRLQIDNQRSTVGAELQLARQGIS
ncbi:MAG: tetratricopeptide repeat protein [Solirubrobacteraceae bacterium]